MLCYVYHKKMNSVFEKFKNFNRDCILKTIHMCTIGKKRIMNTYIQKPYKTKLSRLRHYNTSKKHNKKSSQRQNNKMYRLNRMT